MNSITKHLLNCVLLILFIIAFVNINRKLKAEETYSWLQNDESVALVYVLSFITISATFPIFVFGFLGCCFCNQFPDSVSLNGNPSDVPFICFRIVTRGDYPELVKKNALRHIQICLAVGVKNFIVEIATENPLNVPKNEKIREVVVPKDYQTKSGAMFKARVLQYCLEDHINELNPNDWIVHLDEETIFSENCLRGIVNFILDGKNQFGQGLITYINGKVVNYYTSLADSLRTAVTTSGLQFLLKTTRKPLAGLNGSFIVAQFQAERDVSFDNGVNSSLTEDFYFALKTSVKGYSVGWVEGEMIEESTLTIMDFLRQRKRWMRGNYNVIQSKQIPWKYKITMFFSVYARIFGSLQIITGFLNMFYNFPTLDIMHGILYGATVYSYFLGAVKAFSFSDYGALESVIGVVATTCLAPLFLVAENIGNMWAMLSNDKNFYVVKKKVMEAEKKD